MSQDGLTWLSSRLPPQVELATLQQIHSADVLEARAGCVGRGDALASADRDLALAVVTADCVPVLIASRERIAAVHAGWRGLEAKIIRAAVEGLAADEVVAWVGPAIGPCCYEVGDEVAERIAAVSRASVVDRRGRQRPHLDLPAAAVFQLEGLGVEVLHRSPECTRCRSTVLWSYRREGNAAGRNVAAIWRHDPAAETAGSAGGQ